jgi:adenylosuccinate synthase
MCVAYEVNGKRIEHMPASLKSLAQCNPVYDKMPGWKEDISSARDMDHLPAEAKDYLKKIEQITGVPLAIISVGPMREQTIEITDMF